MCLLLSVGVPYHDVVYGEILLVTFGLYEAYIICILINLDIGLVQHRMSEVHSMMKSYVAV